MEEVKKINETELMPNWFERFIIKISDFKQSFGRWYTVFALRVLPCILYVIPVNVVLGRFYRNVERFYPEFENRGTFLLVSWIIAMMCLVFFSIIAPKLATIFEFVFGFGYLFFAFHRHLYNNILGYTILIVMFLFLSVKTLFLLFDVLKLLFFAGDKKKNIERDETGRVVRATEDKLFFSQNDEKTDDSGSSQAVVEFNEELFLANEVHNDLNEGYEDATNPHNNEYILSGEKTANETEGYENAVNPSNNVFILSGDGIENENEGYEKSVGSSNDGFILSGGANNDNDDYSTSALDDEFVMSSDNREYDLNVDERLARVVDDEFVFGVDSQSNEKRGGSISESDNDFFFG